MKKLATSKIYYKKFNHRMVIKTKSGRNGGYYKKHKDYPTQGEVYRFLDKEMLGEYRSLTNSGYYDYLGGILKISVFYTDEDSWLLDSVLEQWSEDIVDIAEAPVSDSHTELLEGDTQVVVRESLFLKKFRYKLGLMNPSRSFYNMDYLDDADGWCEEQLGDRKDKWNRTYCSNASYYFNDIKDVMMFRLAFNGTSKVMKVVLASELTSTTVDSEEPDV
jgi:hypothetical protein